MESLDKNGREVFSRLLKFADEKAFPLHWGTKGFSMNVNKNGVHVAICYGYPPKAVFKQSIYTALVGRGGFLSKLQVDDSEMKQLWDQAQDTGLFQPAGRELKALINKKYNDKEIQIFIGWLEKVAAAIENQELK